MQKEDNKLVFVHQIVTIYQLKMKNEGKLNLLEKKCKNGIEIQNCEDNKTAFSELFKLASRNMRNLNMTLTNKKFIKKHKRTGVGVGVIY